MKTLLFLLTFIALTAQAMTMEYYKNGKKPFSENDAVAVYRQAIVTGYEIGLAEALNQLKVENKSVIKVGEFSACIPSNMQITPELVTVAIERGSKMFEGVIELKDDSPASNALIGLALLFPCKP